jgi:hypothetical protein
VCRHTRRSQLHAEADELLAVVISRVTEHIATGKPKTARWAAGTFTDDETILTTLTGRLLPGALGP